MAFLFVFFMARVSIVTHRTLPESENGAKYERLAACCESIDAVVLMSISMSMLAVAPLSFPISVDVGWLVL